MGECQKEEYSHRSFPVLIGCIRSTRNTGYIERLDTTAPRITLPYWYGTVSVKNIHWSDLVIIRDDVGTWSPKKSKGNIATSYRVFNIPSLESIVTSIGVYTSLGMYCLVYTVTSLLPLCLITNVGCLLLSDNLKSTPLDPSYEYINPTGNKSNIINHRHNVIWQQVKY